MIESSVGLVPIDEADDLASFGAKARSLARLKRAGLPVPAAFCIPAEMYRDHLRRAGVETLIDRLHRLPDDSPAMASTPILHRVRAAIKSTPIDPMILKDLEEAWKALGPGAVSVRSSVAQEERACGPLVSGHGTYFEPGYDEAVHAIRHCWASLWSDDVWHRLMDEGMTHQDISVAVVVQHLIPADSSGVAFTAHPASGDPERIVIESCFGLGEAIAAGKVPPDRFIMSRDGLELIGSNVSAKTVRILLDERNHITQRAVAADLVSEPSTSIEGLRLVAETALLAEDVVGGTACVEWALHDGEIWLLQARPLVVGL